LTPEESLTHRMDLSRYNRPGHREAILESLADGTCVHLSGDGKCSIWESRPEACREYDCDGDERIERALARGSFPGGAA